MDVMTVHVEAASGPMGTDSLEQAAQRLKHRIKERVGITVEIMAHGSGGVPRSQGKAVRIIDKRPRG
jgi:phenylacetate-CoA ligase